MKHQKDNRISPLRKVAQSRRLIVRASRSILLAGILIASNVFALTTPLFAANPQTANQYCEKYTTSLLRNACSDGINNEEYCADYTLSPDTAAYGVCTAATTDRNNGKVTKGIVIPIKTPDPGDEDDEDTNGSNSEDDDITDSLSGADSLKDYLDILHQSGPDSDVATDEIADDTKGEYINGAGKKQKINTIKEGTGESPVILFLNGGGWHANDQTGQRVAAGEGDVMKAGDRGYAMYDVTYRLGSSGVYYMFEDVMRGIQHMRENAKLYGIDPEKMVIWGDSAGGSLAMRAVASGKTGAKVGVGWSPPTNAYTGLFHSFGSFAIGVDHSTCAPTDLAGFANFADLLNGGSGEVAEYGQGLSSNDFSALGIELGGTSGTFSGKLDPLTLMSQGLIAGTSALSAASDMESVTKQITSGQGLSSLGGSAFNMASKKFTECLDNFNALSPALFASPDTPPSIVGGFENDGVVAPNQVTGMRDKLRQLGIRSEAVLLPGTPDCVQKSPDFFGTGCHLGYYPAFVCRTLAFIDSVIQPDNGATDCETGLTEPPAGQAGTGTEVSSGGGGGGQGSSTPATKTNEQLCIEKGFTFDRVRDSCDNVSEKEGGCQGTYDPVRDSCSVSGQTKAVADCQAKGKSYAYVNGTCVDTTKKTPLKILGTNVSKAACDTYKASGAYKNVSYSGGSCYYEG